MLTVTKTDNGYSVLMSVYAKEHADHLKQSIESILSQTVLSDDIVIVCDGALTPELDDVLNGYEDKIRLIRLPENQGLGKALNAGLSECRYDLVARMDSDDIACPDRIEKQLAFFAADPDLALASGTVAEFSGDTDNIVGKRSVPLSSEEIIRYSHKRNPMNHPAVMFRRLAVQSVGGYNEDYPLFEDYSLWVRMLQNGSKALNTADTLVYMRVDDNTFVRRGGRKYASDMLRFHKHLKSEGWSSLADYLTGALPHAIVCILPNGLRKLIYKKLH